MAKKVDNTSKPLNPQELNELHFGDYVTEEFKNVESSFYINKIEDAIGLIKFPLQPHRKTVNDFLFLTKGKSTRSKNLTNYEFSEHEFFFLPAYQISSHEFMSSDAEGFYCHFHSELFNSISSKSNFLNQFHFYQFSSNPIIRVDHKTTYRFTNILNRLFEEFSQNKLKNKSIIASYLSTLLYEVNGQNYQTDNMITTNAQLITEKYKELLFHKIYAFNKVDQYAQLLSITPDHLNKSVKTAIGYTAHELLAQMIILEAKILLKQTSLTAAEIAYKFCESNPSDFARFFKKQTGFTPIAYRKLAQN